MSGLLARLIQAGTPADLVEEVAMELARAKVAQEAIEKRRSSDRERQRTHRGSVTSRDITGVTECNGSAPLDKKSPQTPKELIPRELDSLRACEEIDLPEGISPELWGQYRAMRKKIRKPLNANAERLAIKHLRQFAEDGHPPGAIVEAAIVGSYQGLFPPKGSKNGQSQSHPRPSDHEWGRTVSAADSLIADLEAGRAHHG